MAYKPQSKDAAHGDGDDQMKPGVFCEMYGATIRNRVLEYLLENQDLDLAIGDLAKDVEISRPKAYAVIEDFEKEGLVKKSRVVGRTQLYLLDKSQKTVQFYIKNFRECIKFVADVKNPYLAKSNIGACTKTMR